MRTGGLSYVVDGAFIRPLPTPCFTWVTVFAPSAISPTMGSKGTLGFLAGRSPLGSYFLFVDGLLEPVPLTATSLVSFFFATCDLISALLLASSISIKMDGQS